MLHDTCVRHIERGHLWKSMEQCRPASALHLHQLRQAVTAVFLLSVR